MAAYYQNIVHEPPQHAREFRPPIMASRPTIRARFLPAMARSSRQALAALNRRSEPCECDPTPEEQDSAKIPLTPIDRERLSFPFHFILLESH